ncbi:sensor histidine kinase, partial [Streptomyces sp. SM14]|uniref:sensor histidine kinase n=2 Tax=unclassified Streptomyces TaxID=2593676 RepID=UPI000CD4DF43
MTRLYDFLRRHPTLVDGFWSLVPLLISLMWVFSDDPYGATGPWPAATAVVLALYLVTTLRRRAPQPMLLLAFVTGVAQLIFDTGPSPANFAFLVITYTVASGAVRWASRLALAGALAAPTVAALRWPDSNHQGVGYAVFDTILITVCFALAWVLGDSLRTRRAYYAELEERASRLEHERATEARIAVAAERARIARELHDVVAHNVSVMVVQADGAAYVFDAAPEQARTALTTISGTGRQALTEMRRLLGVLRDDGTEREPGDYVPQPGLEQLDDLIDQVRGTGLPVECRCDGSPRPLPSGVELTAYRIVQEALTNTRKHGGPGAHANIRLTYGGDALSVLAEDDGRGAQAWLYGERGADGHGHGLIGMRERVGMVGGSLETGPRPGGGFRIRAT